LRPFAPTPISTPTVTTYRLYLQTVLNLRPATINRHLVSLKALFRLGRVVLPIDLRRGRPPQAGSIPTEVAPVLVGRLSRGVAIPVKLC
jgi:hypothetical protein